MLFSMLRKCLRCQYRAVTTDVLEVAPSRIPEISNYLKEVFEKDGYSATITQLDGGGSSVHIFNTRISRYNVSLVVTLQPMGSSVKFIADKAEYVTDVLNVVAALLLAFPLLIVQILKSREQAKLDDYALALVKQFIANK